MDRLICGDVGYGKTEIAVRAAFKAVQDGKQVAYLVPTTILGQQHYNTFVQRMKDYPISIDMLSRFRTAAEQKKTIENLRKGMVDIVIGTHRLLSADVVYKDLGLLIIDEEQRFGVKAKEKIKEYRKLKQVFVVKPCQTRFGIYKANDRMKIKHIAAECSFSIVEIWLQKK